MRSADDDEFGTFDITRCEEGDDRKNFITKESESWLLYWWHRLDEQGFVQFTLCVLDKFQRTNSDEFNLVSGEAKNNKAASDINQSPDIRQAIANNIGKVGTGVAALVYVMLNRAIEQ